MEYTINRTVFTPITVTVTLNDIEDLKILREGLAKASDRGSYPLYKELDELYKELK